MKKPQDCGCMERLKNLNKQDFAEGAAYVKEQAASAKERTMSLVEYMVVRAKDFSVLDFGVLEMCLLSLGLWLGAQLSGFFKKFRLFFFFAFLASSAYMLWRVFFERDED